jgi:hypothetical protein
MLNIDIFGGHVAGVYQVPSGAPSVTRYTEYTSELAKDEIVWTATLRTSERENLNTAVKLYVECHQCAQRKKSCGR